MARKRDPQQLLVRAQQMEEEARRIREEADRIRKDREAKEDRKAGALLRRFWQAGWTGVAVAAVADAANQVFGEPPVKDSAELLAGDGSEPVHQGNRETDGAPSGGPQEIPGLFAPVVKRGGGGG